MTHAPRAGVKFTRSIHNLIFEEGADAHRVFRYLSQGSERGMIGRFFRAAFGVDRLIGYAMLAGFVALYLWNPAPVEFARLKVFDYYVQAKPRDIPPAAQKPVTIIDLDEQSLESVGQWP